MTYGPFGDVGGEGGTPFMFHHPDCRLAYFSGYSGNWLDSLSLHFDCSEPTGIPIPKFDS